MAELKTHIPDLILGTALWGWTIPEKVCFQLLDTFYEAGFRQIDTATNYPINKIPSDFRLSEKILTNWLTENKINDLQVIMKAGSVNNLGGPENELSKSFLLMNLEDYRELLGSNLHTYMIHWDNRSDIKAIGATMEVLSQVHALGLSPGLSGIGHPEVYAQLNTKHQLPLRIEIKHNILQSSYKHYQIFHNRARFLTYGMNAGGLRLSGDYRTDSSSTVRGVKVDSLDQIREELQRILNVAKSGDRPTVGHFYELGILYSYYQPGVEGMIIGPSSVDQLERNIHFHSQLQQYDYTDLFDLLGKIR